MNQNRPCGCKGWRSCLICEEQYNIRPPAAADSNENIYEYCHECGEAWKVAVANSNRHPDHKGARIPFPGVYIQPNFIDEDEKEKLLQGIINGPWSSSQSGRRKQNYGPRCNFKKTKIQKRDFTGFPKYSQFIHKKFKNVSILRDFQVIEQCVLEYDPERGASIDPHIDDCWIWGERIVTVNVIGDTFLTMTKYKGDDKRYNLSHVKEYISDTIYKDHRYNKKNLSSIDNEKVKIYMPEKSLIVIFGSARYEWEHSIPRSDIKNYRLAIAYREFTPPYIDGELKNVGDEIREIATQFW